MRERKKDPKGLGKRFGRLVVMGYGDVKRYNDGHPRTTWRCKCDCGKMVDIPSYSIGKNVNSCGCIKTYENPIERSAREVWKSKYFDGISFEDFFQLSQEKCYYCGINPSNSMNTIAYEKNYKNISRKEKALFIYNGLDRIENSLPHIKDNVVACCKYCNMAKNTKSINEFIEHIKQIYKTIVNLPIDCIQSKIDITNYKLYENVIVKYNSVFIEMSRGSANGERRRKNHPMCSSAQKVWAKSFNDGDIDLNLFFHLSQMKCSYCDCYPSTTYNKFKYSNTALDLSIEHGNFIYNGLDRLTSTKSHTKDNVITCCYSCNTFKLDQEYEQFRGQVIRLYNNIPNFEHLMK